MDSIQTAMENEAHSNESSISDLVERTKDLGPVQVETATADELASEDSGRGETGLEEPEEGQIEGSEPVQIGADEESRPPVASSGTAFEAAQEEDEQPSEARVPSQPGAAEMGELAVEDWDYQRPRRGEIRRGVILSIEEQEIIVDVDAKRDGIVPFADMQRMGAEAVASLSPGDEVDVFILRPEDKDGNLIVSLFQARQSQAWAKARELAESGEIWEGKVIGYNKGGLVLPMGDIRGFVPASQVPGFPQGLSQEERLRRLSEKVGETLQVKVLEINRRSRRLILSATAAQREWRSIKRERLLEELREGEVRRGTVSSLCSFGAFVDLGGADGLVHLSELSWRRVRHPKEVVSVGEEVEVFVLRLDTDKKRIGLSLKRLQPEPWAMVEDKYELGQLVEGRVTNVVDFGAFAEIEDGVEGLIHVSELSEQPISHPREVVKKGDLLLLRIIRIDIRRKRLGLSLKRVLESEWAEWAASLAAAGAEAGVGAEQEEPVEEDETEQPSLAQVEEAGLEIEPEDLPEPTGGPGEEEAGLALEVEADATAGDLGPGEATGDSSAVEEVGAVPEADSAAEGLESVEPEGVAVEATDETEPAIEELEMETANL